MSKLIILTIAIILFIYNYFQISKPYINKISIKTNKINEKIKITQITDFHSNKYINLDKLFKEVENYSPDIIVITGDLIDHKTTDLKLALELVKKAKEITEHIYFVPGNHEDRNPMYPILSKEMETLEVTILNNKSKSIVINGEKINIAGLEFQLSNEEYNKVLKDINPNIFTLILSHSPNKPIEYLTGVEDLILSGHTHGGQVRLPILGAILAPGQGLFPKYDKGIIDIGDTTLYIDSGLGNRLIPIRLFNPVGISNILIESNK